jgi:hypothetical protein
MASYNFKIKHFLFFLLMITNFFSVPTPFTSAISFNFTNFTSGDSDIKYDRAFAANQVIQLTGNKVMTNSVGRATYFKPMHLWDKASGNLTDFTTHFSFVIDSHNSTNYGDGLAFFLAPDGSSTTPEGSEGSGMGLARLNESLNTTANHFVAVEFDIFSNKQWDPPGQHVGIDINPFYIFIASVFMYLPYFYQNLFFFFFFLDDSSSCKVSTMYSNFYTNLFLKLLNYFIYFVSYVV